MMAAEQHHKQSGPNFRFQASSMLLPLVTVILAAAIFAADTVIQSRSPWVENKLARYAAPGVSGETVLMELLDAVIDRWADILERAGADIDAVSREVFEPDGVAPRIPSNTRTY
jgi:hypothetical protein